jgi:hypothetical protein
MRRQNWSGVLAAMVFAATVAVAAQEPASQNSPEPAPTPRQETTAPAPAAPPAQSSESSKITVAGCLQVAPASPIGTSGAAPSVPPAATDAPARSEAASASGEVKLVLANAVPAPAGATASASGSSAPQTYQLIANGEALKPHVGKKVELTGTLEDKDSSPKLRVEAGKVMTEACTS